MNILLLNLFLASIAVAAAATEVQVSVNFNHPLQVSKSTPTLQVVTNPLLADDEAFRSPIAEKAFDNLKSLGSKYTRYVPWFPFPKRAVAALEPPSSAAVGLCGGPVNVPAFNLTLDCTNRGRIEGGKVEEIVFANYGLPNRVSEPSTKMCTSFTENKTCSSDVRALVADMCIGKPICFLNGADVVQKLSEPCPGKPSSVLRQLAVQVKCSVPFNYTSWNFDIIDPMMDSFFENTPHDEHRIPNYSTQPPWMFDDAYTWSYPDDPNANADGYCHQGTSNGSENSKRLISEYYRRLIQYYTKGGFVDEFGERVERKSRVGDLDIRMWEVYNEPESEHSHSVETYTEEYDAVAAALVEEVPGIELVALALCRHGESATTWLQYFLNASNHRTVRGHKPKLDWISYHQYATNCDSADPNGFYQCYFADPTSGADMFIAEVKRHNKIKEALAPHVKTTIDEIGTMLGGNSYPPLYWCASAAYNVYLYLALMKENIDVIGWSQLTAYPAIPELGLAGRDPSVAMLNYTTGEGNARYHVLKMMIEYTGAGDTMVETASSDSESVYAQALLNEKRGATRTIVLLNKNVGAQSVQLQLSPNSHDACSTFTVDEKTGDGSPREAGWDGTTPLELNSFAVMVVRCK
jgi:hypothetical protein